MFVARTLLMACLALWFMGCARPVSSRTAASRRIHAYQPQMGTQTRFVDGRLRVVRVDPGLPAAESGIQAGDVLVSADGVPLDNESAFMRMVIARHANGARVTLEIERAGQRLTIPLAPPRAAGAATPSSGRSRREDRLRAAILGTFQKPGPDTAPARSLPAAPAPGTGFNVLRYAALEPATGEIALWGDYDPAYATGPIAYEALLADALQSPAPSFTLEPTPAGRLAGQELDRRIAQDVARLSRDQAYAQAYALRLVQVLMGDLAERPDGRRFSRSCGEALGVSPAEALDLLQPARGVKARGQAGYMVLVAKMLSHTGNPVAGSAILSMAGNDFWGAMDTLGVGVEGRQIQQDYKAGRLSERQASARLEGLIWGAFIVKGGAQPAVVEGARNRLGASAFVPWARGRFTEQITDRVGVRMFKGVVLGEEGIHRLYPGLPPLELQPTCLDGLDSRSTLAHVFLRADVAMKTVLSGGEMADRVPGSRSQAEFLNDYFLQHGIRDVGTGGRGRTWLQPQAVELRVDPGGQVIRFGDAQVAIRSRVLEDRGGLGVRFQEGLDAYSAELTRRFDSYARIEPDLHRLREAAKVLALARWARERGLHLRPRLGNPSGDLGLVPKGFVQAVFLTEGNRIFLQPQAVGGVNFSPEVGQGWVQIQSDPGVAPSALGQLQASAALATQAADRALAGDPEGARALAQQSADAMTGRLQPGLIPEVPAPTRIDPVPMAQASTGVLGRIQTAATRMEKAPPGSPEAASARVELQGLRTQAQRLSKTPQAATQVVALLHAPGPLPAGPPPVVEPAVSAEGGSEPLTAADRRVLLQETTALRQELCRVQTQFRRLSASVQADQGQRDDWEQEINAAYDRAFDRLIKDIAVDAFSSELLKKWNQVVGKGQRTALERAKLAKGAQALKALQLARKYQDFADWANLESVDADYIRDGLSQCFDLVDGEDVMRKMLMRWLKRPIPKGVGEYYTAAKNVVDTAFDLTAEGFAWARLRQMNQNTDGFRAAVRSLADRQAKVLAGIHDREVALGLPAGATRTPCD